MLHDRSLRKGRDRSLTIERDRVRTHENIYKINFDKNIYNKIILCNLNPVQSQSVCSIVESRHSEWWSSNLIV